MSSSFHHPQFKTSSFSKPIDQLEADFWILQESVKESFSNGFSLIIKMAARAYNFL